MKNQSLQDQLLNAGLTNKTKVKQIRTEKRKQSKKQQKNKGEVIDETRQLVQEAKEKQAEKDRELNNQRHKEAEEKQIANQIVMLINLNKFPKDDENGIAYQFTEDNKVKAIYISEELRNKIISGKLAIVKSKSNYEVVPVKVAEKIKQRDEKMVVVQFSDKADKIEDEEYQGYEIPDDLMW